MEAGQLKQDVIMETVRQWILSGKYKPGEKLPTDIELASHFSVNRRTVAVGLNRLAEESLLDRAPKRGTVVKRQDSILRTNAVALITASKGELYTRFLTKINEHLLEHELYPVLMDEKLINNYDAVIKFMRQMVKKTYPYGSLILGDHIPYEELKKAPFCFFKTVFLWRYHYYEELPNAKYVLLDYENLGKQIVEYFAERNVRRILFPAIPEIIYKGAWSSLQVTVLEHILKYAEKEGIEVDDSLFWRMHSGAPANVVIPMALEGSKAKTGFFAWSDSDFCRNVYPVLETLGKDPMNDFSILGNFNTSFSEKYGFDSFDHQVEEIAEIGVKVLTDEIREDKILVPPKLVFRTKDQK